MILSWNLFGMETNSQTEGLSTLAAGAARQAELAQARIRLANAKAADVELDTDIRSIIEARLPGHEAIPFDKLKPVLAVALEQVFGTNPIKKAA